FAPCASRPATRISPPVRGVMAGIGGIGRDPSRQILRDATRALSYNRRQPAPSQSRMPTYDTIHDASLFAAVGLLLAIITMRRPRAFRKGMVSMVILMSLGLAGLAVLSRYGDGIDSRTLVVVLRELALLVVAFGVVRISVIFLFEGLFPQSSVPRMMADVLMVVALIVYTIY